MTYQTQHPDITSKWHVHQHWDPLRVCVVGRSYPPEFYSWIKTPHVRSLFEQIAVETEEDYQGIIRKLKQFGVEVHRPRIHEFGQYLLPDDSRYMPPPMTPRDLAIMVGDQFFEYFDVTQPGYISNYCDVLDLVRSRGNSVTRIRDLGAVNGSTITRIGRDLFFGTERYDQDTTALQSLADQQFPHHRNHVVNTGGHADGTFCPVCPGLIVSLRDVPSYADTFPDWEVIYLPNQSWEAILPWAELRGKNNGRWWIPGFEHDNAVIQTVETWLGHWVGYVEETVFDVNMLVIDPHNVMVFSENATVFAALARYGVTPHVVPFRHRYFWDGGIHCVTLDLHRDGEAQDWFTHPTGPTT